MRVRWTGLVLALALVAAVVGYGVGVLRRSEPTTFTAGPVVAVSPSYPAAPVPVLPDPDFPALQPGLPLHPAVVGTPPFDFHLPIPRGWVRTNPTTSEWHWHAPPEFVPNTYFIRVKLLGNSYVTVSNATDQRITALENAGDVADLHIDSRDADGFTSTYVAGGHRRVDLERFIGSPDSELVYASIAVIGRERDRAGLEDLLTRLAAEAGP
ncbi:hypothetical protein ABLE68_09650 [Nocardioides sp. CN2-186]|uniref:hypothetical protein n=1 Tax=Nocardioides tweenelious TaxID=3156607 RepID=UPI0032B5B4E4